MWSSGFALPRFHRSYNNEMKKKRRDRQGEGDRERKCKPPNRIEKILRLGVEWRPTQQDSTRGCVEAQTNAIASHRADGLLSHCFAPQLLRCYFWWCRWRRRWQCCKDNPPGTIWTGCDSCAQKHQSPCLALVWSLYPVVPLRKTVPYLSQAESSMCSN